MPMDEMLLFKRINNGKAVIAVVGLGYVGLPLAVSFALKGFKVLGIDTDNDRVKNVIEKRSYISDVNGLDLKKTVDSKCLSAETSFGGIRKADVIIICVPTPLKRKYTPDISFILSAVRSIAKFLKPQTLVVLESTTYPGTTEEIILPELEKKGLQFGRDFFLSFSPERIDPGNKKYPVTKITKVVGGIDEDSGKLTRALYKKIIKNVHFVSSAKAAEMTKLLENSFRIINIGWINEIAMMCHKLGIDVWEVIDAAKTKPFGFMPFYPGLGVGGHCIPDDPLYLYWKAKHHGFSSKFIKLSADINSAMPQYAVSRLKDFIGKKGKILVVGVTYKKDVKDLRKSPPLKLIEILQDYGFIVDYHDPLIPYLRIGNISLENTSLSAKNICGYDCVVIATDHTQVNYPLILAQAKKIFDLRNVYKGIKKEKIIKL
ncbi:MAG: nucleotide sugar dehydrogenase [Candidatus Omnitrophica bacterium]|nr:nucleotide sugar dehydrogenase [Candidatus Omnitrophota bacterium]